MRYMTWLWIALLAAQPLGAQKYVTITTNGVNIRTEAGDGTIIGQARAGDVFEVEGQVGDWYQIDMFSGEWRYVSKKYGRPTNTMPPLPASEALRRRAFLALLDAEDRSYAVTDARLGGQTASNTQLYVAVERVFDDRFKLDACHRTGVQPVHYNALKVEGIKKNWDQGGESVVGLSQRVMPHQRLGASLTPHEARRSS